MISFNVPLGIDPHCGSFPYTPLIPLEIGSALISGISSLASSGISAKTQASANKAYLQGIRETNEMNKELYERQVKDNRANWAIEQAYNSPAMQLAKLRQAGINPSDGVSGQSQQTISSTSAPAMIAPEQTPNPYGNLNLGGAVENAISAYQSAQAVDDMNLQLAQKGIDTAFYYRNKLVELNQKILALQNQGTLNEQEKINLSILKAQANTIEEKLELELDGMRESNKNLRVTRKKIRSEQRAIDAGITNDEKMLMANMTHLENQDKIQWFNANSQDRLARAEIKRMQDDIGISVRRLSLDFKQQRDERKLKQEMHDLAERYFNMEASKQRIVRAMLWDELQSMDEKHRALFGKIMRTSFGFNLDDVFSLSASSILK